MKIRAGSRAIDDDIRRKLAGKSLECRIYVHKEKLNHLKPDCQGLKAGRILVAAIGLKRNLMKIFTMKFKIQTIVNG